MKKHIVTILLSFAACAAASAQTEQPVDATGVPMPFITIDHNPVSLGMASTSIASDKDVAFSAFTSSAVVPFTQKKGDAAVSYSPWAPANNGDKNISAGVAAKLGKVVGLSFAGTYGMGSQYDLIDDNGVTSGTFKTSTMSFGLGLGFRFTSFLGMGVNARYSAQNLAPDYKLSAFTAGVHLIGRIADRYNIILGVSDLGGKVKSASDEGFSLPTSMVLGAALPFTFGEKNALDVNISGNYFFNRTLAAGVGVQYGWNDMVFARAGYRYAGKAAAMPSFASLGLGVKFYGVHIDAAYLLASKALRGTFAVSLGYSF